MFCALPYLRHGKAITSNVFKRRTVFIRKKENSNYNIGWVNFSNAVDTNRVSNLWSICKNLPSLSQVYRKLLRIIVALLISRQYVHYCQKWLLRTENLCFHPSTVLLSKNQLWKDMDFGDNVYGIQRVWKMDTQEPIGPVLGEARW